MNTSLDSVYHGFTKEYLEAICSPKDKTENLNSFELYSAGKIYRQYSFYPKFLKFPLFTQHGVYFIYDKLPEYETKNDTRFFYCAFNRRIRQLHDRDSIKKSYVVKPHFLIYKEFHKIKINAVHKSLLFFPAHSALGGGYDYDIKSMISYLDGLKAWFTHIVVCLGWVDIHYKDRHLEFLKVGYPVVSFGWGYDERYVDWFYTIVSRFEYAAANAPTTGLYYCYDLGLKIFTGGPKANIKIYLEEYFKLENYEKFVKLTGKSKFIKDYFYNNTDPILDKIIKEELGYGDHISRLKFIGLMYWYGLKLNFSLLYGKIKRSFGGIFG